MGTRTEHAPGTFSWVDLSTGGAAGTKSFYGDLLGWEFEDNEIPGGAIYTLCKVDGADACAIAEQPEVPPHWNNYVTVEDADATVAKAKELGANVIEEAFDVMELGRMGVFADPTGAALCVWEPKQNIGAGIVNVPGALTWNELHTTDMDKASSFYGELFGWTTEPMDTGDGPEYRVIRNGERSNGGISDAQPGEPPHWLPYFVTEDLEGAIAKVKDGGGQHFAGPISLAAGQIAIFADPEGAPFALWEGELDE
jgi:predicted enzyme related to lactoylglutathione lyase